MSDPIQTDLSRADQLINEGGYQNALELVEKIRANEDVSPKDHFACTLLESRVRLKLGELEAAKSLVEEVHSQITEHEHPLLVLKVLSIKAEIAWRTGELDDGLALVAAGEEILAEIEEGHLGVSPDMPQEEIARRKVDILHNGGIIYWYKGNLDSALNYHQNTLGICEELNDKRGIANSLNNLGLVFWSKGELDQAIPFYQRSLSVAEELGDGRIIAATLNNLGNILSMRGDSEVALENYQRSLEIRIDLGLKPDVAIGQLNVGVAHQLRGELDLAQSYYQKSLDISEELGLKQIIALSINNLGNIYNLKGELGQALEHFNKSRTLYEELGIKHDLALALGNLGDVYRKMGEFDEALKHSQQSLAIYKEIENAPYMAIVLFELVWLSLEREDPSSARGYLKELEGIATQTEDRVIDQRYRVAKALSLKASPRARHKVKAGEILEGVVGEEVFNHSLTTLAMIHLCELLLLELKVTEEEELLISAEQLTQRLIEVARQQASHALLVEAYLLESKLALIQMDVVHARERLDQAYNIAEEKGLRLLARAAERDRDALITQMQKWESIVAREPSRREMIDIAGFDDLLERMIHKTVATLSQEEVGVLSQEAQRKKYKLIHLDLLDDAQKTERHTFRVGIAQIGVSQEGDILGEFYTEQTTGLFGIREDKIEDVRANVKKLVENAAAEGIDLLIFPELTIDLLHKPLLDDVIALSKKHTITLIPGSYHDPETRRNLSAVISPDGVLWKQEKHIPAIIHFEGNRLTEGIGVQPFPRQIVVANTEFGRIAIVICRDFLDMDLRVELKNAEPPVDLVINPAFTPVTADFRAAHFDARRSIYAYCFFANVGEFGDSLIYTPERERVERHIAAGEEGLISKEIDLFKLRSERKKWEKARAKEKPFIQSTR